MHPENHFYGHAGILARAAYGDGAPAVIRGQIQHGWSFGHGFGARARHVPWLTRLGWGDRTRRQADESGVRNVTLIGSPFLYLAEAAGIDADTPKPPGTIVYPFHSTERFSITASHERLADEIAEREAGRRVTVVLYWTDNTPQTARIYEDRGFNVTCHGRRTDPAFLHGLLAVMADHDRVVSNRCGTALWYGAHLGLAVEIYGPYFGSDLLASIDPRLERFEQLEWPELRAGPVSGADAVALGAEELGARHRRSPEELREILGPPVDTIRRRALAKIVLAEHQVRRVTVRALGTVPGLASIDAIPMPRDLPEVDERCPVSS